MTMNIKQKKIKIEPRIKLNYNSYKQGHSSLSLAFASQFIPSDVFVNLVSLLQTGLRPVDFWGNCYMSNTTDVELAVVDPHKVIAHD